MKNRPYPVVPDRLQLVEDDGRIVADIADQKVLKALTHIAVRNSTYFDVALQQAIINEDILQKIVEDGGQLIVQRGPVMQKLEYS